MIPSPFLIPKAKERARGAHTHIAPRRLRPRGQPAPGAASTPPAALPQDKGAQTPATADQVQKADATGSAKQEPKASSEPYAKTTAESTADTGKGSAESDATPKPADPDVIPTAGKGQNQ